MDPHVWWLRRRIQRTVVRRCAFTAAAGSLLALAVLSAPEMGRDGLAVPQLLTQVPLAILCGQALVALRLFAAWAANPLTARYLRRHIAEPPAFVPGPVPGEPDPVGELLVARGLRPAITVADEDAVTVFDLYQSPDQLVTASVSRRTGAVSFLSALSDGRIVQTSDQQLLPHSAIVANGVPGATPEGLIDAHRSILGRLASSGTRPAPAPPRVWRDATEREQQSYCELGPYVGAFCNLGSGWALGRLLVRVPPAAILDLALPRSSTRDAVAPASRLAVAFGAAPAPG